MTHQSEAQLVNSLEKTFELTIRDADLHEVAIDIGEVGLDSLLDEGVLKDVPILGTLVKVVSASNTIADKLFLKKLLGFLTHLQDISPEDRDKLINEIDESEEYRTKVGEKLLYIVDSCDDHEMAELVGRVFKHFLQGHITYSEFLTTTSVLQRLSVSDFKWFVYKEGYRDLDLSNTGELMHTGLFDLYHHDIRVDILDKFDDGIVSRETRMQNATEAEKKVPYETDVDGGVSVRISRSGEVILEIFCNTYKNKKTVKL